MREGAVRLAHSAISDADRVLVTGAGGWFGSTIAALLHGGPASVMFITRSPRAIHHGLGVADAVGWDPDAIADFAPTIVVDCAFVLRDYIDSMSIDQYVHVNTALTGRLLQLAQLPGLRSLIYVSSGAAVHPIDATRSDVEVNPYGYLKRQAELALLGLSGAVDAKIVVARPWSLSGSLVMRPERYAFSDLLLQARSGHVRLLAAREVLRRYVGVDDFFAVALAQASRESAVLDSAGELVEVGALAERIQQVLHLDGPVSRPPLSGGPADDYFTRSATWENACDAIGFAPAGLDEQILAVDAYLGPQP